VSQVYPVEEYFEAKSTTEAVNLLAENRKRQIIAGGTDLLIKMRENILEKVKLVSIRQIESLRAIKRDNNNNISIGSLVTFSDLAGHTLVQENIPILAEAALTVGGPQIRNMATIGGNICNGVPSADGAPALLAHNAVLRLLGKEGERLIPVREFFLGPGRVDLQPGEMLIDIIITPENYQAFGSCYIKFAPRKAMDLAIVGVAAICRLSAKNTLDDVRISLGVAGPTPLRCVPVEAFAQGKATNEQTLAVIGKMAVDSAKARDSIRASREYREHLIEELTQRALKTAITRTGGIKNA
jgi:xanthine dehydrogenase FAD-binding subunit